MSKILQNLKDKIVVIVFKDNTEGIEPFVGKLFDEDDHHYFLGEDGMPTAAVLKHSVRIVMEAKDIEEDEDIQ